MYMNSPATDAGLRLRDIILNVNGIEVQSSQDTLTRIAIAKPGGKVTLTGIGEPRNSRARVPVSERPAFTLIGQKRRYPPQRVS
jgi:S1-C subfamily serine protease